MNFPIWSLINRLNVESLAILCLAGIFLVYFTLTHKTNGLLFILILTAAFVGSASAMIADLSSLVRWVIILMLLLLSLMYSRLAIPAGTWLFIGYILWGWLSLLAATSIAWQFQRALLLLVTCVTISWAYTGKPLQDYRGGLVAIAIAASIFSLVNFMALFSTSLDTYTRFSASIKGAPTFAMTLGALIPFTYWGLWQSPGKWARLFCGMGFLLGAAVLVISGQRAGTLAGLLGLIPLLVGMPKNQKETVKTALVVIALGAACLVVINFAGGNHLLFLIERYNPNSGLSNREEIWGFALTHIFQNPLLGHGIGAAEGVVEASFHNTYLEVWYNAGLPGLIFFVAAQSAFLWRAFQAWRKNQHSENKPMFALAFGYMLGFFVLCLFESIGAGASSLNVILYLFLGNLAADRSILQRQAPQADLDYGLIHETIR